MTFNSRKCFFLIWFTKIFSVIDKIKKIVLMAAKFVVSNKKKNSKDRKLCDQISNSRNLIFVEKAAVFFDVFLKNFGTFLGTKYSKLCKKVLTILKK